MFLSFVLLLAQASAPPPKPCVILAHAQQSGVVTWSHNYKPLLYVEGELPKGVKMQSGYHDRDLRSIQSHGGKFVTIKADYSKQDLEEARQKCQEEK